jgi:hypothetical protein
MEYKGYRIIIERDENGVSVTIFDTEGNDVWDNYSQDPEDFSEDYLKSVVDKL